MELAVQSWAFNPNLRWMLARVTGHDEGGDEIDETGIITDIKGEYLEFKFIREDKIVRTHFYLEYFRNGELTLAVYDRPPVRVELPDAYQSSSASQGGGNARLL
ncbi:MULTISPECIES: hypothetical protein [Paenibacillus]|uniref:hypothetical protein n=1 Tax=Paenibacillus TaxID=44249 RepID=UPI0018674048|nr:hypothetical protein [Paenibacillus polymyxa]MBE3650915.1 hypothetical protein [Paenibacillus polymyxa]MCV9947826.1 hypothetical protein [Paenibacillus sp. BT-177]